MKERRQDIRYRSLKAGLIIFNNGNSTYNCAVRNISANGAKLSLEQLARLPDEFVLRFQDGLQHDCEVRWRKAMDIGVSFRASSNPILSVVAAAT